MKVVLSPQALDDLATIAAYISRHNPVRARSFVAELRVACRDLGAFPRRYPSVLGLGSTIRRRAYGNYVIVYDVTDQVDILAVIHSARDIDALDF